MKNIFIVALLFLSIGAFSQSFVVKGKVLDMHNNQPIKDADLMINNTRVAQTNSKGTFVFKIHKGSHVLTVIHEDCDVLEKKLLIDEDIEINIFLEHHAQEIEKLNINVASTKVSPSMAIKSIDKKQIDQNSTENLANLLSEISGVNTLKTGNNIVKPVIHGMYGSRILVFNNGVKMAEQEWGVEHAPSIDANAFERLHVIKGAGTLKYGGDAIGGVVVLEPKNFVAKDTLLGKIILSGISNGKGGNGVVELAKTWQNKWFVRTQGSYKKLGDLRIPEGNIQNTGAIEHAFSFNMGHRSFQQGLEFSYNGINQNFGIFKGSHLGFAEDYYQAVKFGDIFYLGNFEYRLDNPKQEVSHHLAKIEAYKRFSQIGKFTAQYAFQVNHRKEFDIRRGEYNTLPSIDLQLTTHSAKLEHLLERERWNLETGITGSFQNNFADPSTQTRRIIPDYKKYDIGVFSVFQYDINPKFKAELGARYDLNIYDAYKYYDQNDWSRRFESRFKSFEVSTSGSRILTRPQYQFHNFSANIGVSYMPNERGYLKFNLSRSGRTPNAAELFADGLHHSAAVIERGDLGIQQEIVYQANVNSRLKSNVLQGWVLEANPYVLMSNNFINQIPTSTAITIRGIFPVWDYQQIKARIFGIDIDSELKLTQNIVWKSQFSTLHGEDLTNHEPLILMAPTQFRNSIEVKFPRWRNAYFRVENLNVLAQKRFPIRNITVSLIRDNQFITEELDISTPPKGYSLWSIGAGMEILKNLSITATITNAFNVSYRSYLNRLRLFTPEMGRNITLSVQYKF